MIFLTMAIALGLCSAGQTTPAYASSHHATIETSYELTAWLAGSEGRPICAGADYQFDVQVLRHVSATGVDGTKTEINSPPTAFSFVTVNATIENSSIAELKGSHPIVSANGNSVVEFSYHAKRAGSTKVDISATVYEDRKVELGGGKNDFLIIDVENCDYKVTISLYGTALGEGLNIVYLGQSTFFIRYGGGQYAGKGLLQMTSAGNVGDCTLTYSTMSVPVEVTGPPPDDNDELKLNLKFGSTTGTVSAKCPEGGLAGSGAGDASTFSPSLTFPMAGGTERASGKAHDWPVNILVTVTPLKQ